jgi:hypothetical protein
LQFAGLPESFGNFLDDLCTRQKRIFRGCDRTSDHQVIRSSESGFRWCRDSGLILGARSRRPHSRNQDNEVPATNLADCPDFVSRGHDPIHTRFLGQFSELDCPFPERANNAHLTKALLVVTGKHGHCEQFWRIFMPCQGAASSSHHFGSSEGVERQQTHLGKLRRRSDGPGDCVRDIMEFQVQEYPRDQLCELPDRSRAMSREQLASDLDQPKMTSEGPRQSTRGPYSV